MTIGIDNGISGALAAIYPDGTVEVVDMPVISVGKANRIDALAVYTWIKVAAAESGAPAFVTFEQGQKNPLFGTKGNYSNGYSCGVVETLIQFAARDGFVTYQCVNPRTWQKDMFKDLRGVGDGDTKGASIEVCRRLFPQLSLVPPRCRLPHDGWADAICMAEYGRRHQA